MKLDRNTNPKGYGKYALVNMRKLIPLIEARERGDISIEGSWTLESFEDFVERGIITLGSETPGDQFFVMKYKDRFTAPALHAYAIAVSAQVEALGGQSPSDELNEYAQEMFREARAAEKIGNRIPD